jgi:uncharacterized coiled-coil protein SlyX
MDPIHCLYVQALELILVFLSMLSNPLELRLLSVTQQMQMLQPLKNQIAGMQAQIDGIPAQVAVLVGQLLQEQGKATAAHQETVDDTQDSIADICLHIEEEFCLMLVSFASHSPPFC